MIQPLSFAKRGPDCGGCLEWAFRREEAFHSGRNRHFRTMNEKFSICRDIHHEFMTNPDYGEGF